MIGGHGALCRDNGGRPLNQEDSSHGTYHLYVFILTLRRNLNLFTV